MSEDNKNIPTPVVEEQEIDLIELVKRLWEKKFFIIKITSVFIVLGVCVALFSTKTYTSSAVIVPQVGGSKVGSSQMASLASLAGINLNSMSSDAKDLSPMVYPEIFNNVDFKKELMYSKIKFSEWEEPITLLDYYTNPEYNKTTVMGYVMKYTIGLPFLLLDAILPEKEDKAVPSDYNGPVYMTKDEFECAKALKKSLSMNLNDKDGYITISATMEEASAAAQVCQTAIDLLQDYITKFKLEKVSDELAYVQERFKEAKADYEQKQVNFARYKDANRTLSSAVVAVEEERLRSEFTIANTIYTELAKQLLQVNLQVKKDTPVLTAVKPASIPNEDDASGLMTLIAFTFLGGILSCGLVFGFDFLKKQGSTWPKKWN